MASKREKVESSSSSSGTADDSTAEIVVERFDSDSFKPQQLLAILPRHCIPDDRLKEVIDFYNLSLQSSVSFQFCEKKILSHF